MTISFSSVDEPENEVQQQLVNRVGLTNYTKNGDEKLLRWLRFQVTYVRMTMIQLSDIVTLCKHKFIDWVVPLAAN